MTLITGDTMNLTHPEQPANPPEDAQFFGPEDDNFWPCWYKFNEGEWLAYRIDRPENGWFAADTVAYGAHTLGKTIFMLEDNISTDGLHKDTQRLRADGTSQLRWANDRVEYFSRLENAWCKSSLPEEVFLNHCPPLADLNWPPQTQEGNDVDSW